MENPPFSSMIFPAINHHFVGGLLLPRLITGGYMYTLIMTIVTIILVVYDYVYYVYASE